MNQLARNASRLDRREKISPNTNGGRSRRATAQQTDGACTITGVSDIPLEPDSPDDDPYQSTVWQTDGGSLLEMMIDTDSWPDAAVAQAQARFCVATDVVCAAFGKPSIQVGALLCDNARMRDLNLQFRGKDSPTNVLSFPDDLAPDDSTPDNAPLDDSAVPAGASPRAVGELALAYGQLAAEANEEDKSLADHMTHLWVHGLAHLFGLDHETVGDAEEMEAAETAILARLGIADPYAGFHVEDKVKT
ncbi:MAG: Endoribonuclease YbeY [SAR116 cluster bacterium]|nr:MAG: Endoribonuclease YbeY [SAR116 cluster bacterium]